MPVCKCHAPVLLVFMVMVMPPVQAEEPVLLSIPVRGMISVTTQYDPSIYPGEITILKELDVDVINTFHGTPSNVEAFLNLADQIGIRCIPSIHLICWIRFGDPPYPPSGPLGWTNILEWLGLYGYSWPDLPAPFSNGPNSTGPLSQEQLEEQVAEILGGFGNPGHHPSILAYYAFDEPSASSPGVIDRMARVHSAFSRLGSGPTIAGIFLWNEDGQAAAREYLSRASPGPELLMYDCYVLRHAIGSNLNDYERYAGDWARMGEEFGVPVIAVPQGFSVGSRPAVGELRAQAYLALAAGCRGISWFRLETLRSLGEWALKEIAGVNRDLDIIGPTLAKLERAEDVATIEGCGGRYRRGTSTTFIHAEEEMRYVFVASKNVTGMDVATVTVSEAGTGYTIESIIDCHEGREVGFARESDTLSFRFALGPGQGRLFRLEGDTSVPVPEARSTLPLPGATGILLTILRRVFR